jgi:hypothetical protein
VCVCVCVYVCDCTLAHVLTEDSHTVSFVMPCILRRHTRSASKPQ